MEYDWEQLPLGIDLHTVFSKVLSKVYHRLVFEKMSTDKLTRLQSLHSSVLVKFSTSESHFAWSKSLKKARELDDYYHDNFGIYCFIEKIM
jgi:hypothetical protein